LFETNTDIKKMFNALQSYKKISDLRESKTLENHVTAVMTSLDDAFSALEDVDYVIDMLHGIGKSHRRLIGFNPEIFWVRNIFTIFLNSYYSEFDSGRFGL
jgi:hypothetical protein